MFYASIEQVGFQTLLTRFVVKFFSIDGLLAFQSTDRHKNEISVPSYGEQSMVVRIETRHESGPQDSHREETKVSDGQFCECVWHKEQK
jgi:hypothetical protein